MDEKLLASLSVITAEEQRILNGENSIDRDLYMQSCGDVINSKKLLDAGKLITHRPHTRFIHFPRHTHDYVEMVYMCNGRSEHIVNGKKVCLECGELLLLNQFASHEVCKVGEKDVAVNFIILPEFFSQTIKDIGEEETPLRRFLVDCLCDYDSKPGYLHFRVSQVKSIQNLLENLLYTLMGEIGTKRRISSMTMSLLFLELMAHTDALAIPASEPNDVFQVLAYVEANYASGTLSEIAMQLHRDVPWLSREIKRKTGKNFTQLVQEKRLAQAAFLLKNTGRKVSDIAESVGYENVSYFHRLFFESFHCSPKTYRDAE